MAKKKKINLTVVGLRYRLTMEGRRVLERNLPFFIKFEREPDNNYDPNAIKVIVHDEFVAESGMHIGYLQRPVAKEWAPRMDSGKLKIKQAWVESVNKEDGTAEAVIELAS